MITIETESQCSIKFYTERNNNGFNSSKYLGLIYDRSFPYY